MVEQVLTEMNGCMKFQDVTKLTKQILMEEALSEQMKERQEMERKLLKLSKTMDHLERAKREEERPLIEEAYHKRLRDDESFYQQQQEVSSQQALLRMSTCVCLWILLILIPRLFLGSFSKPLSRAGSSMRPTWLRRTGSFEWSQTRYVSVVLLCMPDSLMCLSDC